MKSSILEGQPVEGHPGLEARWLDFDAFDTATLHDVLKLRLDVFVVEQACPYPEIDGRDPLARHLLLTRSGDGALAAYLRLFAPEAPPRGDGFCHLGRIVTAPGWRGTGLGGRLLALGIEECERAHPRAGIRLSAQAHLEAFYGRFGFLAVSDVYDEDGIPHIDMERGPKAAASAL